MLRIGLFTLTALLFSTMAAQAKWVADTSGEPVLTPLVGSKAEVKLPTELSYGNIMNGIFASESGDKLCSLSIYAVASGGINLDECYGGTSLAGAYTLKVELPENFAARSIKICQAKKNNRVKGIQLRGKKLAKTKSDNPFTGPTATVSDKLPNCKRWSKWSVCPKHHALTGLIMFFEMKSGSKARPLTGVRGMCRPIKWV